MVMGSFPPKIVSMFRSFPKDNIYIYIYFFFPFGIMSFFYMYDNNNAE